MSDDLNASAEDGGWKNVGVEAFASRSDVLKRAAVAGGAVVAGGLLTAGLPKVAASARSRAQDVRILNYLLRLEYVMAAFYETAAAEGQLTGEIQQFVSVVGEHERKHVALLLGILGDDADPEPSVDFGHGTSSPSEVASDGAHARGNGFGRVHWPGGQPHERRNDRRRENHLGRGAPRRLDR